VETLRNSGRLNIKQTDRKKGESLTICGRQAIWVVS
jgi:hypothetical protein